jgi:hypothetical protein
MEKNDLDMEWMWVGIGREDIGLTVTDLSFRYQMSGHNV